MPWDDVVVVHVAGPYDACSRAEVRGRRDVRLLGVPPDDVRALVRERGLPAHDSASPRPTRNDDSDGGDGLDGPYRRSAWQA